MRTGASGICRIDMYGDGTADDADADEEDDEDDDKNDNDTGGAAIGDELLALVDAVTSAA